MTDQREQQLASRTVSNVGTSALLAERRSLQGVDAFAGAVANVLIHSISPVTQNLVRDSSEQSGWGDSMASIAITNGSSSVNHRLEYHPQVTKNGGKKSRDSRQARQRHYQLEMQCHHSAQSANQNQMRNQVRGRSCFPLGSPTSYELARPCVALFEPPSLFVERRGSGFEVVAVEVQEVPIKEQPRFFPQQKPYSIREMLFCYLRNIRIQGEVK